MSCRGQRGGETTLRWARARPIARKEARDVLQNGWVIGLILVFLALLVVTAVYRVVIIMSFLGGVTIPISTAQSFQTPVQRTLVNSTHLILPLGTTVALVLGYGTISTEREQGTLSVLLTKPISRTEVLVGKVLGVGTVLSGVIVTGVVAASASTLRWEGDSAIAVLTYLPFAVGFGLAVLAVGVVVSTGTRSRAQALIGVLVAWFLLVLWDAVLAQLTPVLTGGGSVPAWYYAVALVNPLTAFRSATGRFVGGDMEALPPIAVWPAWFDLPAFAGVLGLYVLLGVGASVAVFLHQDIRRADVA